MAFRVFIFVAFLVGGALVGIELAHAWGAAAAVTLAAVAWFTQDLWRGARVVRWLRRTEELEPPRMRGLWGEIIERARRALRAREQATADAQARLQHFLEAIQASPNGVVLLDAEGRIEWCNQTAALHFGFDAQRDVAQLVGNLVRDPAFTAYMAVGDFTRDVVIPGRDNTPSRPSRLSVRLHPYGEGRKLLLSRDITALEQAETMRRDFVANVSHEIRTPLTVLAGFVESLQTLPLDDAERARYLGLMSQQAHRMQALVSDLLTLSRLEGSPLPAVNDWIPLPALQAQCEDEARGLAAALGKGHALRFAPAPPVEISVAGAELVSAMSNLVGNAIRYTPAGGDIDAGWTRQPDGRLLFSVRDTGAGIAAEHLPRLTERFYRVDRSRSRETGGTGLGLAIVKHVVQRHGGELRIASTVGAGSTFSFTLPGSRVRESLSADAAGPAPRATAG
ncbi:phosphate regulon sensor histidine kinase PhoR [Ramlibacter sp. MAHUQ-53]|uniref:phosphate regulon sensor histidine kinase PhoR n=1 Tax=unclassified Ramlibacter TaxID=2617605 RepID=UPI0036354F9D